MTGIIPFPLQEALRDSITPGIFVDTKFWLFSKRASKSGRVGEPKPLFVNGHVAYRALLLVRWPQLFGILELTLRCSPGHPIRRAKQEPPLPLTLERS